MRHDPGTTAATGNAGSDGHCGEVPVTPRDISAAKGTLGDFAIFCPNVMIFVTGQADPIAYQRPGGCVDEIQKRDPRAPEDPRTGLFSGSSGCDLPREVAVFPDSR